MADDEVVKLIDNLKDLNSVSYEAGLEFQGLAKRLIKMSDNVSGSGKKWTIFSRIVSGSPIWKLQNKVRAFVDSLALIEQASKKNSEAQKEADEKVINLVKSREKLKMQMAATIKLNKGLIKEQEKLEKGEISKQKYLHTLRSVRKKSNDDLKEAVENTVAYNKAILLGRSPNFAFQEGLEEVAKKAEKVGKAFVETRKVAKFEEGLKIRDLSDPKEKRKRRRGMMTARKQVKEDRKRAKAGFSLFGASNFKGKKDPMGKRLKKLVKQGKRRLRFDRTRMKLANFSLKYQKFMLGVGKMARPILNYAFKVMVMVMLGIVAFFAFAKIAYDAFGFLQEFGVFEDLKRIGFLVLDTAKSIIELIMAVVSGDVYKFIEHGEKIVKNIIGIGILAVAAILKTLFALAVGVFYSIIDFIEKLKNDKDLRNKIFEILMKAGALLIVAYFIKYMTIKLMEIAAIYALPVLIGVILIVGITALLYKVVKEFKIGKAFERAKEGVKTFLGGARDRIKGAFADGGTVSQSGLQLVGERGPELVTLPKGSRVHSNKDSGAMLRGNSVVNNVNVTINAKDTSDAELRRIADQVGNMITNKMNRSVSSSGFVR